MDTENSRLGRLSNIGSLSLESAWAIEQSTDQSVCDKFSSNFQSTSLTTHNELDLTTQTQTLPGAALIQQESDEYSQLVVNKQY